MRAHGKRADRMEGLGDRVCAVVVGCMVDLIAAKAHLLEHMPQYASSPPRAQRHCHIVCLHNSMPHAGTLAARYKCKGMPLDAVYIAVAHLPRGVLALLRAQPWPGWPSCKHGYS